MKLDHVQVAAPAGCEEAARAFDGGLLGLREVAKPEALVARGGVWFAVGDDVERDEALSGVRRFYTADPFGNRIELLA